MHDMRIHNHSTTQQGIATVAKTIAVRRSRPRQDARGRGETGRRRRRHDGPDRPQRDHRQVVRRPDRHQGRRDRQQGNRARRPVREHGRQARQRSRLKTSDIAGDGTTTATVLARAIFKEGLRNIAAGSNPMAVRRGIEKAVDAAVEHLDNDGQDGHQQGGNRPGRRDQRQQRPRRSAICWPTRWRRSARTA